MARRQTLGGLQCSLPPGIHAAVQSPPKCRLALETRFQWLECGKDDGLSLPRWGYKRQWFCLVRILLLSVALLLLASSDEVSCQVGSCPVERPMKQGTSNKQWWTNNQKDLALTNNYLSLKVDPPHLEPWDGSSPDHHLDSGLWELQKIQTQLNCAWFLTYRNGEK